MGVFKISPVIAGYPLESVEVIVFDDSLDFVPSQDVIVFVLGGQYPSALVLDIEEKVRT